MKLMRIFYVLLFSKFYSIDLSVDDADLEMESLNNNLGTISSSNSSSRTDGLRRRGQDSLDSVSIETPTDEKKRKRRKPADSATVFFRLSWPSILGQVSEHYILYTK